MDCYGVSDELISDKAIPPREELDDLGLRSHTADELEEGDANFSASDTYEPEPELPKLEAEEDTPQQQYMEPEVRSRGLQEQDTEEDTLQQQYNELEARNCGLQERDTNWRKLFKKFMQRAADVQRKDASKHQIKKGFKELHKIVKEWELQGL